jgi:hypothetical protein
MVKDIDLESDLDLRIVGGDFVIADSDQNHVINLMKANTGGFKQFPLVGVGIDYYIASSGTQQVLKRNITVQLGSDGYEVNKIEVLGEAKFSIDAKRIE